MKKLLFTFGILILAASTLFAQAPQSFKYQAVARDIEGNILSDQQVSLKINLLQGDKNGKVVYSETHNLNTNQFGLLNLEIGMGKNKSSDFSSISWGISKYFVHIEIDVNGGSNYKSLGVSQLLSVPYALYAESSGSGSKSDDAWVTVGNNTTIASSVAKVGISNTAPAASLHVIGTGVNAIFERSLNTIGAATNRFYKSRGITAAKTTVLTGDYLGSFQWWGYTSDGTWNYGAILGSRAENIGSSDVAGNFVFLTTDNTYTYAERMRITADGWVGIGTASPTTKLHLYENNTSYSPSLQLEQEGTGDVAMTYLVTSAGVAVQNFTTGIDNVDNDNFLISSTSGLGLTGAGYSEPGTMMRIHTENQQDGIIDFNHQSRARVWVNTFSTTLLSWAWTPIMFDVPSYDEHGEWLLNPAGGVSNFVAIEEGYYQVNARAEIIAWDAVPGVHWGTIAIWKTDAAGFSAIYALGNNLNLYSYVADQVGNNNAPNVSDVVYLKAGEKVDIRIWHNIPWPLSVKGGSQGISFCSIHKLS